MGFSILDPQQRGEANHHAGCCALTIMAKAPRPGRVKTRLTPPLTPEQAFNLSTCLLRDTAECLSGVAARSQAAAVVSYTPAGDEALFEGILPKDMLLIPQRGDGFGERLFSTAEDLFACGFSSVCLVDSDSPTVPAAAYLQAVEALATPGDRVILGPTTDGGYYLLGIKHSEPRLFQNIAWSTGKVYSQTLERARSLDLEVVELPLWYDVDDEAMLSLLRAELLAGIAPGFATLAGYPANSTRQLLERTSEIQSSMLNVGTEAGGAADQPVEAAQRPLPQTAVNPGDHCDPK